MIEYLTPEDLLYIHSAIISETGGSHGLRERDVLVGITISPKQIVFGKEFYPTLFDKAAVYVREIVMRHPFVDGNKRTGITSAFVFLDKNEYIATAKQGSVEKFAVEIAVNHLEIPEIAKWLKKNSRKQT
ncbi:MAG: type II toxin-antitoxin system death-on-curing family toxin [Patescibacteria group bacterium]